MYKLVALKDLIVFDNLSKDFNVSWLSMGECLPVVKPIIHSSSVYVIVKVDGEFRYIEHRPDRMEIRLV